MQTHNVWLIKRYWSGVGETSENQFLNQEHLSEKKRRVKLCNVTAKQPGYKVRFKVMAACPSQIFRTFEDNFQLFSYTLCILKKKVGQRSPATF